MRENVFKLEPKGSDWSPQDLNASLVCCDVYEWICRPTHAVCCVCSHSSLIFNCLKVVLLHAHTHTCTQCRQAYITHLNIAVFK